MLQNRVTPFGELVAVPERGAWTGNRGVLHDDDRRIVRRWQNRRWIVCVLELEGRRRTVMTPGRWTELFFLDEATALAAGHRPCAHCRRPDFDAFVAAWPHPGRRAPAIDDVLHRERLAERPPVSEPAALPDGAMVARGGTAYLVRAGALLEWTPGGYLPPRPDVVPGRTASEARSAPLVLLTPLSTVAALANGYIPHVATVEA